MRQIVNDVLQLARAGEPPGPLDVNEVITSSVRLLSLELRKLREVRLELAKTPPIRATPGQLGQVVINLLMNACQAATDPESASIVVRTRATDDNHVVIEVDDNGPGVPSEVRARIFEPFFTTKAPGSGSGLGLSISQQIVSAIGGRIELVSRATGTTFRVTLPAAEMP